VYAGCSAVGVRDCRCCQENPPELIQRADIGLRRPPAHCDARANTAEADARPGSELATPHQVVCQIWWENGDIEGVAGLDPTLEIGSKFVTDHKPVSGCAFELRGKLPEHTARRRAAENSDLGRLRWAALVRQSQAAMAAAVAVVVLA
jgi:hypothetical protein